MSNPHSENLSKWSQNLGQFLLPLLPWTFLSSPGAGRLGTVNEIPNSPPGPMAKSLGRTSTFPGSVNMEHSRRLTHQTDCASGCSEPQGWSHGNCSLLSSPRNLKWCVVSGRKAEMSQSESKDWKAPLRGSDEKVKGGSVFSLGFSYQLPLRCYHLHISFREGAFSSGFWKPGVGSLLLTPKKAVHQIDSQRVEGQSACMTAWLLHLHKVLTELEQVPEKGNLNES